MFAGAHVSSLLTLFFCAVLSVSHVTVVCITAGHQERDQEQRLCTRSAVQSSHMVSIHIHIYTYTTSSFHTLAHELATTVVHNSARYTFFESVNEYLQICRSLLIEHTAM
jgi:hypothetical protein